MTLCTAPVTGRHKDSATQAKCPACSVRVNAHASAAALSTPPPGRPVNSSLPTRGGHLNRGLVITLDAREEAVFERMQFEDCEFQSQDKAAAVFSGEEATVRGSTFRVDAHLEHEARAHNCEFHDTLTLENDSQLDDSTSRDTIEVRSGSQVRNTKARWLNVHDSAEAEGCTANALFANSDDDGNGPTITNCRFKSIVAERADLMNVATVEARITDCNVDGIEAELIYVVGRPTISGIRPARDILNIDLSAYDPDASLGTAITIDTPGVIVRGDRRIDGVGVDYPPRTTVWIDGDEPIGEVKLRRSLALRDPNDPLFVDARNEQAWEYISLHGLRGHDSAPDVDPAVVETATALFRNP